MRSFQGCSGLWPLCAGGLCARGLAVGAARCVMRGWCGWRSRGWCGNGVVGHPAKVDFSNKRQKISNKKLKPYQVSCMMEEGEAPGISRKKLGPLLAVIPSAIDLKALAGAEPAAFDDGTALSMSQLARLACDSSIGRIVLSATGEVLDAGRSKRLFTPGQTRAVIARDRTCRYPGCSETIQHGQIHHALPWKKGGATDLANAVLLCWHHHALVHREMTTVAHHDGGFVFTRPDGTIIGTRRHGV